MGHGAIVHGAALSASRRPAAWCALLSLGAAFAVGCGNAEESPAQPEPAPLETEVAPEPEAEPSAPEPVHHTVEEGQTLWDIARAYGVAVGEILQANGMRPEDVRKLRPGKRLHIPGATAQVAVDLAQTRETQAALPPLRDGVYHHLQPGESLWSIARHYDVLLEALMSRNALTDETAGRLRVGQAIVVPGVDPKRAPPPPREPKGVLHTMAPGETVWDLARTFKVSVSEIMAANGLSEQGVTQLRDGAKILIPGVERDRAGKPRRGPSPRQRRAEAVAKHLGLGTRTVALALLNGKAEPSWIRAAGSPSRLPGTLRWPVAKGWFVRGFGSGEGNYHQAVDIMGEIGWNVRAAAPGIVAYAGDELRGYGNVVQVVHPGGWITMYAHNSVNFVYAGEKVQAGAILAEVGSTGISRGPHVHFELMFNGGNCDPAALFRPGIRHRDGHLTQLPQARWLQPNQRPRQVRCEKRKRHPRSRWVVNE